MNQLEEVDKYKSFINEEQRRFDIMLERVKIDNLRNRTFDQLQLVDYIIGFAAGFMLALLIF